MATDLRTLIIGGLFLCLGAQVHGKDGKINTLSFDWVNVILFATFIWIRLSGMGVKYVCWMTGAARVTQCCITI